MTHLVFVYGTLLSGEVNHHLLAGAKPLGPHRTAPRFTLVRLGAYPGLVSGGSTAVFGELYRIDSAMLSVLDRLEEYPRLYDRKLIPTPHGRAWVYLFRGTVRDRKQVPSGDWRMISQAGSACRAAAVRRWRDPKNPGRQRRSRSQQAVEETAMTAGPDTSGAQSPEQGQIAQASPQHPEVGRFTLLLEQREGYQVNVAFDWKRAPDLLMDEPPPLGETNGPNASRLLAAAVGNCLSASLLYCLGKEEPPDESLQTEVTCIMVRNEQKRMRVGRLEVRLILSDALVQSKRFERCKSLFEDFCVVSASIRQGIPIGVSVVDQGGRLLHASD